ncbi:MAG: hypothetical protein CVU89_03430 [Firmicutes bacterium HGW-Firmicutes-14]|jgi:ABC-type thiamine transport system ATPase subunit|nr:MAG: hypothetical protein CVU89_03430 [Firmicutes bacterium HGW-Firmicutes-14]
MKIDSRLKRLEQNLFGKQRQKAGFKTCFCRYYGDQVSISGLNFEGPIEEAEKLIRQVERESEKEVIFVTFSYPETLAR